MKMLIVALSVVASGFAAVADDEVPFGYTVGQMIVAEGGGANGMPYVNTKVKPTQNTRVVMTVDVQGAHEYWFGCWDSAWNNGAFAMGNDAVGTYVGWGGDKRGTVMPLVGNGLHVLDLSASGAFVDSVSVRDGLGSATFSLQQELYLFAQNRCGSPSYREGSSTQCIHCYSCKIYDGEMLIRDFVPCSNPDGEAGFYDLANGGFYSNSGTGTLVCSKFAKLVSATAAGYCGPVQPGGSSITVLVTNPPEGAGCTYEWSTDGGTTWSDVQPRFTEVGVYEVSCRISCEGYETYEVSETVQIVAHDSQWTYDETKGLITDGVWNLAVVKEAGDELTITGSGQSVLYPGISLDLAKPVDVGLQIVAIGAYAFQNNDKVQSVTLPTTLREIGASAFYGCKGLTTVTPFLPPSVTTLGGNTFERCESLVGDLSIGSSSGEPTRWWSGGIPAVGQFAHTKIGSVTLHSATNIPKWAFIDCPSLVRVEMRDDVREIAGYAFSDCVALQTIDPFLSSSIVKIGQRAFENCSALTGDLTIGRIGGPMVEWTDEGSVEDDGRQFTMWSKQAGGITSVTLNAVTNVPNDCFEFCTSLTNVTFNSPVACIGRYAFATCTSLTTVTPLLPPSVHQIGGYAFYQCNNLAGDVEIGARKVQVTWNSRYDPKGSYTGQQFAQDFAIRSLTIHGDIDHVPTNFLAMSSAVETVRIESRTDFVFCAESLAGWDGRNPPIRDLYVRAFATFDNPTGKEVLRYRPDYKLRFWVPADNAKWQSWVASNVDPFDGLDPETKALYYAEFGETARKPVGLMHADAAPSKQWLMWQPNVGMMIFIR